MIDKNLLTCILIFIITFIIIKVINSSINSREENRCHFACYNLPTFNEGTCRGCGGNWPSILNQTLSQRAAAAEREAAERAQADAEVRTIIVEAAMPTDAEPYPDVETLRRAINETAPATREYMSDLIAMAEVALNDLEIAIADRAKERETTIRLADETFEEYERLRSIGPDGKTIGSRAEQQKAYSDMMMYNVLKTLYGQEATGLITPAQLEAGKNNIISSAMAGLEGIEGPPGPKGDPGDDGTPGGRGDPRDSTDSMEKTEKTELRDQRVQRVQVIQQMTKQIW